jgi:hypothetical protein
LFVRTGGGSSSRKKILSPKFFVLNSFYGNSTVSICF